MSTTIITPDRTTEQRMSALARANVIRCHRAALKRDVRAGRVKALPLIMNPGPLEDTMKVFDLMLSMPKIGRVKANAFLRRARVSPSKTLGGLSERQRLELVTLLGQRR